MSTTTSPRRLFKTFPSAFSILFLIMLIAIILTWIVPAGSFAKLAYDKPAQVLVVTPPTGASYKVPATQAELDRLGVSIDVKQFVDGTIRKPIAIPGTYERLAQSPKGLADVTESMVKGTIEGVDIIVFILVLGGLIGVVNATGAFNAGLVALSKKAQGNEFRSCSSPRCVR